MGISGFCINVPLPLPRRIETELLSLFNTAISDLESLLKSCEINETGAKPVEMGGETSENNTIVLLTLGRLAR